jgi:hypothetical protein
VADDRARRETLLALALARMMKIRPRRRGSERRDVPNDAAGRTGAGSESRADSSTERE